MKYALPALSGLLLWASFHPLNIGILGWVALVPLILFSLQEKGGRAFLASWLGGWVFFTLGLLWIRHTVPFAPYCIALYKGLYFPLFGFLLRRLRGPLTLTAPIAWIALEFTRSYLFGGLPYLLLGYTQHEMLIFIQSADLFGPWLISGLVMAVNALVVQAVLVRRRGGIVMKDRPFRLACGSLSLLLAVLAAYGAVRLTLPLVDGPRVVVIQPNIAQELKRVMAQDPEDVERIYRTHEEMTARVFQDGKSRDLVVWPESVIYEGIAYDTARKVWMPEKYSYPRILRTVRSIGTRLFLGLEVVGIEPDGKKRYGNSAVCFDPEQGIIGRYDKIKLVPFAEKIPGPDFVRRIVASYIGRPGQVLPDFSEGREQTLFEAGGVPFGAANGYEVVYPDFSCNVARKGGRFLVHISNEGWFRDSAELDQMLAICRFRAIESRMSIVRGTNTGISAFIEPTGRVAAVIGGKEVQGVLDGRIRVTTGGSLYRTVGDLLAWLAVAAAAAGGALHFWLTRKNGPPIVAELR